MAYSFKNQPTATAQIERYVEGANGTTFKLAGINGEQTDAGNFRTAIADFIGIGGITIAKGNEALQRTINQAVESDGEDPQLIVNPSSVTITDINQHGSATNYPFYFTSSAIPSSLETNRKIAAAMTLSGKKPIDSELILDGNTTDRAMLKFYMRKTGNYTTGDDSATINIHMNSVTINGTKYAGTDLTITITGGIASEFEDIT